MIVPVRQSGSTRPATLVVEDGEVEVHSHAAMTCYPHSFWSPAGGFIRAKYADYGKFNLIDSPINRIRLIAFFKDLVTDAVISSQMVEKDDIVLVRISEAEDTAQEAQDRTKPKKEAKVVFDITTFLAKHTPELAAVVGDARTERKIGSFDPDMAFGETVPFEQFKKAWQYIEEAVNNHVVFLRHRYIETPRPMEFAVMHSESFKALVDVAEGPGVDGEKAHPRKDSFKQLMERSRVVRTTVVAQPDTPEELHARAAVLLFEPYLHYISGFVALDYPSEIAEISYAGVKCQANWPTKLGDWLAEVKDAIDARMVIAGLNAMNLVFTPMTYANQNGQPGKGRDYAKLVQQVCSEVVEQRKALAEEDDE